jgi:hypothetical protein
MRRVLLAMVTILSVSGWGAAEASASGANSAIATGVLGNVLGKLLGPEEGAVAVGKIMGAVNNAPGALKHDVGHLGQLGHNIATTHGHLGHSLGKGR